MSEDQHPPQQLPTKDDVKVLIKEVVREIIDESFATFGRWSARALFTLAAGWVIYIYVALQTKVHHG